jgi:2-methylcitrate dehydratase PrpD
MTTGTLSQNLALVASGISFADLSATARKTVKRGFIDCIAVMIAGAREPTVRLLRETLCADDGGKAATLHFSGDRSAAWVAAWVNGAASHVLDYDDFARGHPSAVLIPALLAEGEVLHVSGSMLMTAYAAGYETWMSLALRERDNYQMKGWHPTSLIGAIAAAAACARLRCADPVITAHALGLAAAQASGPTASYGTMAKAMQVGRASSTGLLSARMAAAGMTAAFDALDAPTGFLHAISPAANVDLATPEPTAPRWHIEETGLSIKRYPFCYCAHRVIDGAIALHRTGSPLDVRDIERIDVEISDVHASILKHHSPQTTQEAIFSVEFAAVASLIAGRIGFAELSESFIRRDDVQALMQRVQVATHRNYDPEFSGFGLEDRVRLTLAGGTRLDSGPIRYPLGHARNPLSLTDLEGKFVDCLAAGGCKIDAAELFTHLAALENLDAVQTLYSLSAAQAQPATPTVQREA